MTRQKNTAYMLRQWLIPAIAVLIVAVFLISQLLQGNYLSVAVVVALVALAAAWTLYGPARQERKLLQSAAPEPLLAHYERTFAQAPIADRDAALAFHKAVALTLYGRYDDARAALAVIDWPARPPLIQAQKTLLEAWWAYLAQPDPARGLRLAQQARELADVSFPFPGAGQPLAAYAAAVDLGQLLTGAAQPDAAAPDLAARLEDRLPRQPLLLKALLAWGLVIYYQRSGPPAAAARLRQTLQALAPHCAGLPM